MLGERSDKLSPLKPEIGQNLVCSGLNPVFFAKDANSATISLKRVSDY